MRKFLHMAGGIAKKTLATAAKLAKKLAHIVLQALVTTSRTRSVGWLISRKKFA